MKMATTSTIDEGICQICQKKHSKKKLSIFVCDDNYQVTKDGIITLVKDLRKSLELPPVVVVPDEPPVTGEGTTDKYGIKKIYPDETDRPEHQYLDMNNLKSGRVDNYPSLFKPSNESVPGGFKAVELGSGRVALFSSNGNPFSSVEHTVYFKFLVGGSGRLFQPYIGGGSHHNEADRCCEGFAMKTGIHSDGAIKFRKEICHDAYCGDRNGNPSGAFKGGGGGEGMIGKWYGFKQIELHLKDRNRMEIWLDEGADDGNGKLKIEGNENRWKLVAANEDKVTGTKDGRPVGDWTASGFDSTCTKCVAESRSGKALVNGMVRLEPYHVTHRNSGLHDIELDKANSVVLRIDGDKKALIAYWSARKILPSPTTQS